MVILSLIVKRTQVKALVKDKRTATEAFGTYVEVGLQKSTTIIFEDHACILISASSFASLNYLVEIVDGMLFVVFCA